MWYKISGFILRYYRPVLAGKVHCECCEHADKQSASQGLPSSATRPVVLEKPKEKKNNNKTMAVPAPEKKKHS